MPSSSARLLPRLQEQGEASANCSIESLCGVDQLATAVLNIGRSRASLVARRAPSRDTVVELSDCGRLSAYITGELLGQRRDGRILKQVDYRKAAAEAFAQFPVCLNQQQ